ncbi:MAG TPA: uroporphyrinogen-III synthase [Caulobacteraceae bacterium]|jgi:uroporphyrinogen-III synthase
MRVWVTRTQPGADATAARLRDLGHQPIVSPVLEVRRLKTTIDLDGVDALAFTSRNGVEAFSVLTNDGRALPVFAVGQATADAARACGFANVRSANGDVEALAALIASERPGVVLHPTAREPAGELGVRSVAVYETVPVEPTDALARLKSIDAVLVHSPLAARRLAALVAPAQASPQFLCISQAAAAPLRAAGHEKVRSAPFPDEAALLKLLDE